jgi:deoxyribose-phosphate aldolase
MVELNSMIDYTLLDVNATDEQIIELCNKANVLDVKSVCVYPKHIELCLEHLHDNIEVCTVIDFPDGSLDRYVKFEQAYNAIDSGATEIDVVMDYNLLKEKWIDGGMMNAFDTLDIIIPIKMIADLAIERDVILKVIVESGELSIEQVKFVTNMCIGLNVDYIKTSTGKTPIGAEIEKIKLMSSIIDEQSSFMKIKASGGIRTMNQINEFSNYCTRLGIGSSTVDKLNSDLLEEHGFALKEETSY